DLAGAFGPDRTHVRVVLLDELHVDRADVGVHRHLILGEIRVDVPTRARIDVRLLEQRHANAPHHAALNLAPGRLFVEHAADRVRCHDARHADDAEIGVDVYFAEHRAERVHGVPTLFLARLR